MTLSSFTSGGYPNKVAKHLGLAAEKCESKPGSFEAYASLANLGEVVINSIEELLRSASNGGTIDPDNDLRALADQFPEFDVLTLGGTVQSLTHHWSTNGQVLGMPPYSLRVEPDVAFADYCGLLEVMKERWSQQGEGQPFVNYKELKPSQTQAHLAAFLQAFVQLRNITAHPFKYRRKNGTVTFAEMNEEFWQSMNIPLLAAIVRLVKIFESMLTRYSVAQVLEVDHRGRVTLRKQTPADSECWSQREDRPVAPGQTWFVEVLPNRGTRLLFPAALPLQRSKPAGSREVGSPGDKSRAPGDSPANRDSTTSHDYTRDTLQRDVEAGLLVPVIGPGCYRLRRDIGRGGKHVRLRLDLLKQVIRASDATQEDMQDMEDYAESVAISNLCAFDDKVLDKIASASGVKGPDAFERRVLVNFQTTLVRLGVELSRAVGRSLTDRPRCISDIQDSAVLIRSDDSDRLLGLIRTAVAQADEMGQTQGWSVQNGLGAGGLEFQLSAIGKRLKDKPGELHLSVLEWTSAALWHTLRVNAPLYPAPNDLAFQLAVSQLDNAEVPRRYTFGAAASALKEQELAKKLAAWLPLWSSRGGSPSEFDWTIARALRHAETVKKANGGLVPVVFDLTFESGLEEALRGSGACYNVLFPAHVGSQRRWVMASISPAGRSWLVLDPNQRPSPFSTLQGPIVVKPNGAPLTELPLPDSDSVVGCRRGASITHRVIASYHTAISSLTDSQLSLPAGVQDLLERPTVPADDADQRKYVHTLLFMGFRLTDSSSRLRLYQLRYGLFSADPGAAEARHNPSGSQPWAVLVDKPKDPVQHAIFQFRQNLFEEDTNEVIKIIDRSVPRGAAEWRE